ncbi:hypothetical protein HMPREF9451_01303 [Slackia piriformis YIT 12062]|uniref:Uncharacterized protein n=1 Tax=Slackia piriformis YIT 12062 TaxID=742818 RepID=K0YJJ5_9ACTN|nr:hypothetical protein HMPREF9451_01303 [Slackia piriformis YIT 12062]
MPFLRFVIENTCISKIMQINQRFERLSMLSVLNGDFLQAIKGILG